MKDVDVNKVLDLANFRGLPLLVVLCTTLILILDGLDIQIISLVAPLIAREFHVLPASLGLVLAAALVGMAIGGFLLGGVGDRWGRKPALLFSVALFAASTLMAATAGDLASLTAWRLVTGVGLGGAIPNAMALLAEFTGRRWRTPAIAAAVIGVPIGGMIGAVIAGYVLPVEGWRTMFVIGGLLPLLVLIFAFFVLPESPRYLAIQPSRRAELAAVLNRLARTDGYTPADNFQLPSSSLATSRLRISALLERPLLRETCGIWLIFLSNMFAVFTFFSWSPLILSSLRLPLSVAVRGSAIFNLAGVCGGAVCAWVISRAGSRWPTAVLAVVGSLTLWTISRLLAHSRDATSSVDIPSLMAAIAVVGFVMIGIQTSAYRLSTHLYPTQIRSSGVGWAAGIGRIGGILSSLIAGWLLVKVHGVGLFAILACVVLVTLLGVLIIRNHLEPLE